MWNPTKQQQVQVEAAAAAAAVSGNKKKKEVAECQCESEEFLAANNGCAAGDNCFRRLQQQQNTFASNSKDNQQTRPDKQGGLSKTYKFVKDFEAEDEAIDSGFLSGPQTSSSLLMQDNDDDGDGNSAQQQMSENKLAVPEKQQPQQQQQQQEKRSSKQQETKSIFDSGCIEAEYFDEDNDNHVDDDAIVDADVKVGDAAETVVVEVKRQFVAQVKDELPNATVAAVATLTTTTTTSATTTEQKTISTSTDQMRDKNNVDSGIAERLCSLSLQTAGAGTNNLNASPRRPNTAPMLSEGSNNRILHPQHQNQILAATPQQQQQQQHPNAASTTKANNTRLNDWEQFYQQNSDGDT